jgi:hypothetical protein
MSVIFCGVDESSRRFGRIQKDFGKRFVVLWTDGSVSEESMPSTKKKIMNSPSFFALVRPERNADVFDTQPLQLVLEVLWEKKMLNPRTCSLDKAAIREAMALLGIDETQFEASWKNLSLLLKAEKRIQIKGGSYQLVDDKFEIHNPLSVDWLAIERESDLEAPVNLGGSWQDFYLGVIGLTVDNSSIRNPSDLIQTFLALDEEFKKLDKESKRFLISACLDTNNVILELLACWVTSKLLSSETKTGKDAVEQALNVIRTFSDFSEKSSSMEVAVAKLSELVPEQSYIEAATSFFETITLTKALFTLPPGDYAYKSRITLAGIAAKELRKSSTKLSKKETELVLQLLQNLGWSNPQRDSLNEALISTLSPIVCEEAFWTSFDLNALGSLAKSAHRNSLVGRTDTKAALSRAVRNLADRLSASELLKCLPYFDFVSEVLGQEKLPELLTKAMNSNPQIASAFREVSNSELIVHLQAEISSLAKREEELKRNLSELSKELELTSAEVRGLQSRLSAAAKERNGAEDQNREKFEIEAARSLARVMDVVERYGNSDLSRNHNVVAALGMVGLSLTFAIGETVSFSFEVHEDPEGAASDGDTVLVVANGYRWTGSLESVVVQKALVSKVNG